jgi:hypothetical protein
MHKNISAVIARVAIFPSEVQIYDKLEAIRVILKLVLSDLRF